MTVTLTFENFEQARASGGGADKAVGYLTGSTSSSIAFPKNSIPETFTICSVENSQKSALRITLTQRIDDNADF